MPNPGPDESSQSAAPKVSIVVPVYNPGPYLERCISSVLAQTMPPGELEAIFVDDGSTDGSGARLDALAADHPHIRVIHEENSGWGGKPRNVGIEAARGEFVLFLDHDDRLGPEAAERLHARAIQDGSDVILGRTIGHGRLVGSSRGWYTRGPVTFEESPGLIAHLRPHKLVRRQFLLDTGIRFPEGRRRLEDHAFVLEAYFRAHAISVVGDYACYHQIARADRGNAGAQHWEPAYYYGYVREDIQIIERFTEPGPFRNRLLARLVRWEMLSRLSGTRLFLSASPERRRAMVDAVRPILEEHVPLEVDAGLAPGVRVLAALTRADRLDLLETFGGAAAAVRCRARVRSLVRGPAVTST